jgi:hypothetical protein
MIFSFSLALSPRPPHIAHLVPGDVVRRPAILPWDHRPCWEPDSSWKRNTLTRRPLLAAAAAAMAGSRSAAAFSPTDPKTSKLALESNVCRSAECSSAALKQLKPLLDVSNVQVNAKGAESAHDLVVVKCAAFQEMDDNSIVVKVRVTAEGLDLVDNVAIIWIANTSTGEVLAARAETRLDWWRPNCELRGDSHERRAECHEARCAHSASLLHNAWRMGGEGVHNGRIP